MQTSPCEVCGHRDFKYLLKGKDRLHHVPGTFDLYQCKQCGLVKIWPFLKAEEISKYYPKEYSPYKQLSNQKGPGTEGRTRYYLHHPLKALNALLYSKILGHNRNLPTQAGLRVLDVGCGDGAYLLSECQKGCECFGVDISKEALKRLKQRDSRINIYCGSLEGAHFSSDFFDVVNFSHVLEHVTNPKELLREIKRVMKPGAFLRLQVPNSASLAYKIFGPFWMGLDTPRHFYVFSRTNLKAFLENQGFRVVSFRTLENAYALIGSLLYVYNAIFKKKVEMAALSRIWDSEIIKIGAFPYALFVNLFNIGDSMEFVLKKP